MKQAQKAIVAALVPLVIALLAQAFDRAGVDVKVDPTLVETAVSSVVAAVLVWLVPNKPPVDQ